MKAKPALTGVLLLFVAASLAWGVLKESGATGTAADVPAADAQAAGSTATGGGTVQPVVPRKVLAYYFHGQKRCNTCRAIQAQSREAIETGFPEALMAGTLEFREVDTEAPGNDHYVTDYDLVGSSLVLVDLREGRQVRFKNLARVWDLWADRPAFLAYVQQETRPWLEAP